MKNLSISTQKLSFVLLLTFFLLSCDKNNPVGPVDNPGGGHIETKSATIGIQGGTVDFGDGTKLIIPQGALSNETEISISKITGAPSIGQSGYQKVILEPSGIQFNQPVALEISYDDYKLLADELIHISLFNEAAQLWETLKITFLDKTNNIIRAEINHFSEAILAYSGVIYGKSHGDSNGSTGYIDYHNYRYKVIRVGSQWWLAENLRTTKYNDGSNIPNIKSQTDWLTTTNGAWCDYDNNPVYGNVYGKYYNWYAVNTGLLAPHGWHVPSDEEWQTLEIALGMSIADAESTGDSATRGAASNVGGKIKEAGASHWNAPNEGANNNSGFTALGGGNRPTSVISDNNWDGGMLKGAAFWTSYTDADDNICARGLEFDDSGIARGFAKKKYLGLSVRCILD